MACDRSKGALRLQEVTAAELATRSGEELADVLGIVRYGVGGGDLAGHDLPVARVEVEVLGAPADTCEVWRCARPLRGGRTGPVRWRADGSLMFLSVDLAQATAALQDATEAAYRAVFAAAEAQGYPHLLRIWNHIGSINDASSGLERYRQFNIGRQQAFVACGRQVAGASVPAASALGASERAPLAVYALATRTAPTAIENPRQVSAYHYPSDYGPRAPTFSRANLVDLDGPALFVSGTASIVGHRSVHLGDVREQTRETLRNIAVLLDEARERHGAAWDLGDLHYKAYLRRAADLDAVRDELARAAGRPVSCLSLQADVCRAELLVEIEAVALPGGGR